MVSAAATAAKFRSTTAFDEDRCKGLGVRVKRVFADEKCRKGAASLLSGFGTAGGNSLGAAAAALRSRQCCDQERQAC
jgi:hypothetical protein